MSTELEKIKLKEKRNDERVRQESEKYYWSEEAKQKAKEIKTEKQAYLQENPTDYLIRGVDFHQFFWYAIDESIPVSEQEIFILTGKGLHEEYDNENYNEAIRYYQEADDLTMKICADDIQELIKEYGPGDYLYTAKLRQRVRVCEKRLLSSKCKKLEKEARELEKTNPEGAINIYNELNILKPGLKKYDKRIELCRKKLN